MRPSSAISVLSVATAIALSDLAIAQVPVLPSVPVVVTNPSAKPVPVTGNITAKITNTTVPVTGTVNANVTNTPNVVIANTPSVTVTSMPPISLSGAALTIDPSTTIQTTDRTGRDIVRLSTWLTLVPGFSGQALSATITDGTTEFIVPAGKRMVINHISVWAEMPTEQVPLVAVTANGIAAWPEMRAAFDGKYVGSSNMPLYVDGGGNVSLWFERSPYQATETAETRIQILGYLIDCAGGCTAIQ